MAGGQHDQNQPDHKLLLMTLEFTHLLAKIECASADYHWEDEFCVSQPCFSSLHVQKCSVPIMILSSTRKLRYLDVPSQQMFHQLHS